MISTLFSLHTTCALISILLFTWRGIAMWTQRPLTNILYRRILPDSIDTILLVSGITLAFLLDYSLLESGWLIAKIVALFVYIGLGEIALNYGRSLAVKRSCFIAAISVFAFILFAASRL